MKRSSNSSLKILGIMALKRIDSKKDSNSRKSKNSNGNTKSSESKNSDTVMGIPLGGQYRSVLPSRHERPVLR